MSNPEAKKLLDRIQLLIDRFNDGSGPWFRVAAILLPTRYYVEYFQRFAANDEHEVSFCGIPVNVTDGPDFSLVIAPKPCAYRTEALNS